MEKNTEQDIEKLKARVNAMESLLVELSLVALNKQEILDLSPREARSIDRKLTDLQYAEADLPEN
jgi:hypothetical protein